VIAEALVPEVGLAEIARLDHRPHRAVEDEDALACELVQPCPRGLLVHPDKR
jgi:hypothetical protein